MNPDSIKGRGERKQVIPSAGSCERQRVVLSVGGCKRERAVTGSTRWRSQLLSRIVLGTTLALSIAPHPAAANVRVEIKDPKGVPVADAVASLTPLGTMAPVPPPAEPVVITQEKEEFVPYVTALLVGTRVSFPNRDKVQHHVFSISKTKAFDLGLYRDQPRELVTFEKPGVVTLGCNIHDWMSAYVVVLATPFFAKSQNDGLAPIADIPPGKYTLEVWHPRLRSVVTREVNVEASAVSQVISVTLGVDRRIRRAPESGTASYK